MMKKLRYSLLIIFIGLFNWAHGQDIKYSEGETEVLDHTYIPLVCPLDEERFCRQTKFFFTKKTVLNNIRFNFTGDQLLNFSIILDSLGRYQKNHYSSFLKKRIEDNYFNQVVKKYIWDILPMKWEEFHDKHDNKFYISLLIVVTKNRKVEIYTQAFGKYDTYRYLLCK